MTKYELAAAVAERTGIAKEYVLVVIDESISLVKRTVESDEALTFNGDILATYRSTAGRTTIDSKKLKEKYPQAYAECSKVGAGGRTFRLK